METTYIVLIILTAIYIPLWIYIKFGKKLGLKGTEKVEDKGISPYGPCIMIRTKIGLRAIDFLGKYKRFWRVCGILSRIVTILLMTYIVAIIILDLILLPQAIGKGGTFTRLKGLDNGTNKELLIRHMKDMDNPGLKLSDFQLVLPSLSVRQIQWLLKDLEATSRAYVLGRTKAARWFLGKRPPELTSGLTRGLTSDLTDIDKSDEIKSDE